MADYNTYETYQGDGTTRDFAIPFDYVEQNDVIVERTAGDPGYVFINDNLIRLNTALAVGQALVIRRETDVGEPVATWRNGAAQTAEMLNSSFEQVLYATQEARDLAERSLYLSPFNTWDAKNYRIVNVGAPISAKDATTKQYVDAADQAVKDYVDEQLANFEPPSGDGDDARLGADTTRIEIRANPPRVDTVNSLQAGDFDIRGRYSDATGIRFLGWDTPYQMSMITTTMATAPDELGWHNGDISLYARRRYQSNVYTNTLAWFTLGADANLGTGVAEASFQSSDFLSGFTNVPMKIKTDGYEVATSYGNINFANPITMQGNAIATLNSPVFTGTPKVSSNEIIHAGNIDDYATGLVLGTPVLMNGLSVVDLTNIPSDATEVNIYLNGVSSSGTGNLNIQSIDSVSGVQTSGYYGNCHNLNTTTITSTVINGGTSLTLVTAYAAADFMSGQVTLKRAYPDTVWSLTASFFYGGGKQSYVTGLMPTPNSLSGVRLSLSAGTVDSNGGARVTYRK